MGYQIVTFDEASFRIVPVYKRVWFIKGKKPRGFFFWSNRKINIFGALVDGKKFHYGFYESMNTITFLSFLSDFVGKLPEGKYVFLMDNAPYHKSSTVRKYLEVLRRKGIVTEFFPPYSPELDPTETCWKTIRREVTNSTYFQTIEKMRAGIVSFLAGYTFNINVSHYLCR